MKRPRKPRAPAKKKPTPREVQTAEMVHAVLTSEQVAARWRLQAERMVRRKKEPK